MKKLVIVLFVLIMVPLALQAESEISVAIDGVRVQFPDQLPVIVNDRTLVPVGSVFNALGFTPTWNPAEQTATLTRSDFTVVIAIGSANFTTNGENFMLDVPAQIISDRTMLPLRAVLESIEICPENIGWDEATRSITIITDGCVAEGNSATAAHLVGIWDWASTDTTTPYYEFNANGTGTRMALPIRWATSNNVLSICTTPELCGTICIAPTEWHYSISGNELTLTSTISNNVYFVYSMARSH